MTLSRLRLASSLAWLAATVACGSSTPSGSASEGGSGETACQLLVACCQMLAPGDPSFATCTAGLESGGSTCATTLATLTIGGTCAPAGLGSGSSTSGSSLSLPSRGGPSGSNGSNGSSGGEGSNGSSGAPPDAGVPACTATGFASSAATFALPSGYTPLPGTGDAEVFPGLSGDGYCGSPATIPAYSVLDVTGDGVADLVLTRSCTDATVGDTHWLVYPGGPGGFATASTSFALPPGYAGLPGTGDATVFPSLSGDGYCGSPATIPAYSVLDVTGDHVPDLVVTRSCTDATVGDTHWLVYAGRADGFAASATSFALPAGYQGLPGTGDATVFPSLSGDGYCGSPATIPAYSVVDVTGDHLPDLVVTRSCTDATVGDSHWLVYAGGVAGFAAAAATFALPSGYEGLPGTGDATVFPGLYGEGYCGSPATIPAYSVLDVTGDHIPDLVVTRSCTDATVGDSKWLVYAGGGTGFAATAATFALPGGYHGLPGTGDATVFAGLSGDGYCGSPATIPAYTVLDLTGDGVLDLVVTRSCTDTSVGDAHWLVYAGGAAGFAATATSFALPPGYTALPGTGDAVVFAATSGDGYCGSPATIPAYTVLDVTGDGKPDVLVTKVCTATDVGNTQWLVYAGECGTGG